MDDDWNSYFCKVNDNLASIYLNLGLMQEAPMLSKSWLLWVWVHFNRPRPDGLSGPDEAPVLFEIEDKLNEQMKSKFGAILSGRITTEGRREFYFYGEHNNGLEGSVASALEAFNHYEFDCGSQEDATWTQYLNVLYPSEEELQKMKNHDVLEVLERQGDMHSVVREVSHWVYFQTAAQRDGFLRDAMQLGYREGSQFSGGHELRPFGIILHRNQAVTSDLIDEVVIELFRLARHHGAEYDGWETSVEKTVSTH
jgi:regulator of RNase E activity RraB